MRGPKIKRAIASLENFWGPRGPSRNHISGMKMFFYCNFSTKKHLQIAIKHLNDGWSSCNFRGPFTGPLEPSQNRCFAGAARSFRLASGPTVIRPLVVAWVTWPNLKFWDPSISSEWLKIETSYLVQLNTTSITNYKLPHKMGVVRSWPNLKFLGSSITFERR